MYSNLGSPAQLLIELQGAAAPGTRWLLCVADSHGDQIPDFLELCRQQDVQVFGGLFPGLIYGSQCLDTGVLAVPLPEGSQITIAALNETGVHWKDPLPPAAAHLSSSYIFIDCLAPNISDLLECLYDQYGNHVNHVGAGAGYHDLRPSPTIFTTDGMLPNAGLVILTPRTTTVQVRHGWHRLCGPFVASRTQGNIIQELNWEPAGQFYRQQVAETDPALADRPIFPDLNSQYPLCISKEGCEDVMRDPIALTADDEIIVLSDVAENSVMFLAHGDRQSLVAAARQAVVDCGAPARVETCFISDCYSRALMLSKEFSQELEGVEAELARFSKIKPEGVLALGEIATNGRQSIEFFNKTFVIALGLA